MLRRAQWLIIPFLVLVLAEGVVRLAGDRVPTWYGAADRLIAERPVEALFVGSSRVQAAIRPSAFAEVLSERRRPGGMALNLGRGYSTDAEHYLGLRNLLAAHPENMRGVTVFVEALGGMPVPAGWKTIPWSMAEQPWMLVDLLRPSDLPAFWMSPGLDVQTRAHISVRLFLRRLALLNRRERVREQWLEEALPALARGRLPALSRQHILGADLMGPGPEASIRTDPQALAAARSLAEQIGAQLAAYQGPIRGWRGTIQEDLVRLVRAGGGHVVFFDPPESEVFSRSYRAPIRREDAAAFARQVEKWGACMVRPAFSYRDEDLPDLWHLRPERVDEYTRALTASWLDTCAS